MLEMRRVALCTADPVWTLEALHLASALARDTGAEICLVKMIPVDHAFQLGAPYAHWRYSAAECETVQDYLQTLEDYGVSFSCYVYQYVTYTDALVDLCEQLRPQVLFAKPHHHLLSLWNRLELWNLRRRLARRGCLLYTLEAPLDALVWPPARAGQRYEAEQQRELSHT